MVWLPSNTIDKEEEQEEEEGEQEQEQEEQQEQEGDSLEKKNTLKEPSRIAQ